MGANDPQKNLFWVVRRFVGADVPQENLFWVVRRSVRVDNLQENLFWVVKESGLATTSGLSSTGEKNLYHPKFKVDDMVLAELMDMEIPFCSEQILVEHQLSNYSSPAAIAEFAFNFLGHHQHLNSNNSNNNSFANLQAGCSPPANYFWPLGHPIPSPHFTYEAGGAGIQLQHNSNLLCYKKTLENLVTSSSSLKKEEAKSQVVKQVARAASLRATTAAGKLDHHHHGLTL